jgi:hypothetical protein
MTFKVSESILMLKKAKHLGKIGGTNESILMLKKQGDCRKEPQRDLLCTKTKINQNSWP